MRVNAAIAVAAAALLLVPGASVAQSSAAVDVVTRVGVYAPLRDFGPAAPTGGDHVLVLERSEPSASLATSVEIGWPGGVWSTRAMGQLALPADVKGAFNCYSDIPCLAIFLGTNAEVMVLTAAGDLVYSPLARNRSWRPYALVGAGMKRHEFSWENKGRFVEEGSHAETTLALHAGVGVAVEVLGLSLQAEVADFWSGEGSSISPPAESGGSATSGQRPQHDIGVTVGVSLLRF